MFLVACDPSTFASMAIYTVHLLNGMITGRRKK